MLAFNSYTSSSLPYLKSEFEGLFIFTLRWRVHVLERGMIHRGWHGGADRILCSVREIALRLWRRSKQWRGYEPGTLCSVTGRPWKSAENDRNNTPPPRTLGWPWPLMHRQNPQTHSLQVQTFRMCYFLKGGWSNKYAILPQGLETINKQVQGFNPEPFVRVS